MLHMQIFSVLNKKVCDYLQNDYMPFSEVTTTTEKSCLYKSKEYDYAYRYNDPILDVCLYELPANTEFLAPLPIKHNDFVISTGPVLVKCLEGAHVEGSKSTSYMMECVRNVATKKNCIFEEANTQPKDLLEEFLGKYRVSVQIVFLLPFSALIMAISSVMICLQFKS
ncbi:hypothetical protein MHBO_001624 [Bonamia ostreae]|uniref:Uncharacterized protein n=1 Tax=Bonamia ostreae TaxID=126728 RepID=A0ABV2AJR0_9EUKA